MESMPKSPKNPLTLPAAPLQPQAFKLADDEAKSGGLALRLLETILEEQAGLREGVRQLEESVLDAKSWKP